MSDNNSGPPKSPWGKAPRPGSSGSGGMRPPDFETLLRKFWADLRRHLPEGVLGRRGAWAVGILAVAVWLALGVYTVTPQEQGVVLRFGAFVKHTGPGTYWHLPWPIETAYTPNVDKLNTVDVGFKPAADANGQPEDVQEESYMLTGDDSIVAMRFTVNWRIKDANAFLFNVDLGNKSTATVKAVAESAMREVVGQDRIDLIMTSHREEIQTKVQRLMQAILDSYNAGIEVVGVKMQKVESPSQVRGADADVQKALADQDKKRDEAEVYANALLPQARGEAARIVQDAEGYRQQAVAIATGEAERFNTVYQEYKKAPDVTRRRLYLETMTQVLGPMNKIIVDDAAHGVTVQLPLPPKPAAADRKSPASEGADQGGKK